ncbi:MAG: hypothetical protein E7K72_02245 [Roseomonas mucosa]|nr:hypothetical protein [Roseomonas mucosa]
MLLTRSSWIWVALKMWSGSGSSPAAARSSACTSTATIMAWAAEVSLFWAVSAARSARPVATADCPEAARAWSSARAATSRASLAASRIS